MVINEVNVRHCCSLAALLAGSFLVNFGASAAETSSEPQKQESWWQSFTSNVQQTWSSPDHYDLYVPAITWHNRWTYDKEKTDRYNERPWGAGGGVSRYDEHGNWNGIYLMVFKDSFNKWEPIGGYGWEKTWRPLSDDNFRIGAGYTVGVTARDNWNYIPTPVLLPLASVGYGPATFQMTYIPGTYNNGNVFFAWGRWTF